MRTETRVTVGSEFFDWVAGGDDYLYESELWNHCRIQTTALGGERTGEDDDVKSFFFCCSRIGIPRCEDQLGQLTVKSSCAAKIRLVDLSSVGRERASSHDKRISTVV